MANSLASWDIQIDRDVFKALEKLPQRDGRVILEVIRLLPRDPYLGDIQKMKGEQDIWRRRIGAYRIFYKLYHFEKLILVFRLERRTSNTY